MRLRTMMVKVVVGVAAAAGVMAGGTGAAHAYVPDYTAVNADGGVYWRNSANWNDTSRIPGWGFYNGDDIALDCWQYGGPVDPYGNTLWYWGIDLSEPIIDSYGNHPSGWINDHFLNTPGTAANPQPLGLPCG